MSKAYDRVEWSFLFDMMKSFDFCTKWINLIFHCVSSVSYSIVMNGRKGDEFTPSRGLKHKGPLSPYLFIFCVKGFFRLINFAKRDGLLGGVK